MCVIGCKIEKILGNRHNKDFTGHVTSVLNSLLTCCKTVRLFSLCKEGVTRMSQGIITKMLLFVYKSEIMYVVLSITLFLFLGMKGLSRILDTGKKDETV